MEVTAPRQVREVLSRPGAIRRWAVVLGGVCVLALLPAAIAAWPADPAAVPLSVLLTRVQGSARVPYQGFAESTGRLNLPDLGAFEQEAALFSDTTRMRVWYSGPDKYRVDTLTLAAEQDYYRNGNRGWIWDSDLELATLVRGFSQTHPPTPPDLLPGELGRRLLSEVSARDVARGQDARVAGRACVGLLVPADDPRSSVDHVSVCVDPGTGVPLAASVVPKTDPASAFDSRFLDFDPTQPAPADVRFNPRGAHVVVRSEQEGFLSDPTVPVKLPARLAGLPQRSGAASGVATYGTRYTLLAVAPVSAALAYTVRAQLDSESRPPVQGPFGEATLVETPLVSALAVATDATGWLLTGTVTRAVLEQAATQLVTGPYGLELPPQPATGEDVPLGTPGAPGAKNGATG